MYLDKCPPAISGCKGHDQTFKVACALVNVFGQDEEAALYWMRVYNQQKCQPHWSIGELRHKVRDALRVKHALKRGHVVESFPASVQTEAPSEIRPLYDPAYLERFTAPLCEQIDAEYLEVRGEFTCWNRSSAGFLYKVFRPGEHVWVTDKTRSSNGLIWTHDGPVQNLAELNHLRTGQPGVWFLSNPIDGAPHQLERLASEHNANGISFRAAECVTDWRYVVLETDDAPEGLWLKALCLLRLPVVAIYHSGNRGAHALVNLGASTVEQWHERLAPHREHLIRLGACSGTLTPVRLSRLPNCIRGQTGNLQRLLYLTPNADSTPIAERPVREHPLAIWERYLIAARYGRSDNN
jgi:hypothetical protein